MGGGTGGSPSQSGASIAARSAMGAASSPADVTVSISGASRAALAADNLKVASAKTVQPTANSEPDQTNEIEMDRQNGAPITVDAPNSIAAGKQKLLHEGEWDIDDLLLALLLLRVHRT
ncbi:MAG TPA: hypothetical protein VFW59_03360 [Gallionella sp.]|nr:hypothetical protein [Gallionella sp.]